MIVGYVAGSDSRIKEGARRTLPTCTASFHRPALDRLKRSSRHGRNICIAPNCVTGLVPRVCAEKASANTKHIINLRGALDSGHRETQRCQKGRTVSPTECAPTPSIPPAHRGAALRQSHQVHLNRRPGKDRVAGQAITKIFIRKQSNEGRSNKATHRYSLVVENQPLLLERHFLYIE